MSEILSTAGIKREILDKSEITGIRKKISADLEKEKEEARSKYVEIGEALERMTNTPGWVVVETYIMENAMKTLLSEERKDITKGMIHIVQWIDQMVRLKNEIKTKKDKEKNEP